MTQTRSVLEQLTYNVLRQDYNIMLVQQTHILLKIKPILGQFGYQYSSSFLNSEAFTSTIIPYSKYDATWNLVLVNLVDPQLN